MKIDYLINGRRKRLHVFVDHEKEEPIESVAYLSDSFRGGDSIFRG
jgi:hypothetical protein